MKAPSKASGNKAIQPLLTIFASLACLGAIWRMMDESIATRIDETTLLYLAAAGALLLMKDVKSLAFGSNKVEKAQAAAVGGGGAARADASGDAGIDIPLNGLPRFIPVPGPIKDDPWKDVSGRQRVSGVRELDAEVTPIGTPGLFRIRLQVRSTNSKRDPLKGSVQFFLHPTFGNDRPVATVGPGGNADLTLTAWGAFTVGALADDGRTMLELDLAELARAPP